MFFVRSSLNILSTELLTFSSTGSDQSHTSSAHGPMKCQQGLGRCSVFMKSPLVKIQKRKFKKRGGTRTFTGSDITIPQNVKVRTQISSKINIHIFIMNYPISFHASVSWFILMVTKITENFRLLSLIVFEIMFKLPQICNRGNCVKVAIFQ